MHRTCQLRHQTGLSLVELMISLTLGLIILAALLAVMASTSRSREELGKVSEQHENGRYATVVLAREVALAGFYGEYAALPPPSALPDPCATAVAALQAALSVPVQGYGAVATSPLSCLETAEVVPESDVLVIRRAHTVPLTSAPVAGEIYLQANTFNAAVQVGSPAGFVLGATNAEGNPSVTGLHRKDGVTAAEIRKLHTGIYYLRPCFQPEAGQASCTAAADGGAPVPTLVRKELVAGGGSAAFVDVPLVAGIEAMVVQYGVDADADGVPESWHRSLAASPLSAVDFANVVAVRLGLLARSSRPSTGYQDNKVYTLGEERFGPYGDNYRRQPYNLEVRLDNIGGKRE